jgi:hypothetical protein
MKAEGVPRGFCPACRRQIGLDSINIATQFPCPYCKQAIRVSTFYRGLLYVACYVVPTVVVLSRKAPILVSVLSWFAYAFIFGLAFIFLGKRLCTPRLRLAEDASDGDFQSLGLGK